MQGSNRSNSAIEGDEVENVGHGKQQRFQSKRAEEANNIGGSRKSARR
jgi:hypothetical protein